MLQAKEIINTLWQRHSINLMALIFMATGMLLNSLMLSLTHERVPIQMKPLPDVGFDLLPRIDDLIVFCELYITIQNLSFLIVLFFHLDRERIFRRFTIITGLAYMVRSLFFPSTTLPPSICNSCSPKFSSNITIGEFSMAIIDRMVEFSQTFGFVTQRKISLCGDQIFSGHTIIIIMVHLFIDTYYYPVALNTYYGVKCGYFLMKTIHWLLSTVAITSLIISHQHYTIDIIASVYVCTQIFWTYHSLCMEKEFFQKLKTTTTTRRSHVSRFKNIILDHTFNVDSDVNNDNNNSSKNFIKYFWWWPLFVHFEIENQLPSSLMDDE
nr:phosphatidylcholine:ceramide cholinephosphotransferase 1-like [Dermatophagoides farinae]